MDLVTTTKKGRQEIDLVATMTAVYRNGSCCFDDKGRQEMDRVATMAEVDRKFILLIVYCNEKGKQNMDHVTTMTKVNRIWIMLLKDKGST